MSAPPDSRGPFLSTDLVIPEDWEKARLVLNEYIFQIASSTNAREVAQYQDATLSSGVNISTLPTGQNWFVDGDANKFRAGTRTVVNMGALQDYSGGVATQTSAHGITTTSGTKFTRIYGVATDPGASTITQSIPLPYVDVDALGNGIELWVDATNVNLRYNADYSAFTSCYVVLEWVEDLL